MVKQLCKTHLVAAPSEKQGQNEKTRTFYSKCSLTCADGKESPQRDAERQVYGWPSKLVEEQVPEQI